MYFCSLWWHVMTIYHIDQWSYPLHWSLYILHMYYIYIYTYILQLEKKYLAQCAHVVVDIYIYIYVQILYIHPLVICCISIKNSMGQGFHTKLRIVHLSTSIRYRVILPLLTIINHYQPLLTIINHYWPLLTIINSYQPLLTTINH